VDRFKNSLSILPSDLSDAVISAYDEIRENYLLGRWEPSELNGGKLAEVVYRVLEWESSGRGTYTSLGKHVRNFGSSVRKFTNDTSLPDGIRFHIPQALDFLYTLRNKRGVGHAAGDISPNHMDAAGVLAVAKWVLAEIVRLLNSIDVEQARLAVEEVTTKSVELVWVVNGKRRVLSTSLGYRERTLVILYREHPKPVEGRQLFDWVEYSSWSAFKTNILRRCHAERLVDYDEVADQLHISPAGIRLAEELILQNSVSAV